MPGGGGMGPGASEVPYDDFVGVTTNGKVQDDPLLEGGGCP